MKTDHPITRFCETLEVSCSGYHASASGADQRRARADEALRPTLHAVFAVRLQLLTIAEIPVEPYRVPAHVADGQAPCMGRRVNPARAGRQQR